MTRSFAGDYRGTKTEFIIGFYQILSIRPCSRESPELAPAAADLGQDLHQRQVDL